MNTRLQVEHPVTEAVTGLDLVRLQFAIAAGHPLPFAQADLTQRGHAIECRLYAEDPQNGFLPATGQLLRYVPPAGPGVRVDSGVQSGDDVSIHYDPMLAKIIVHDRTRADAIARMQSALRETVILGLATNLTFLRTLLAHPLFVAGEVDTTFIERQLEGLVGTPAPPSDAALITAALSELTARTPSPPGEAQASDHDPWAKTDGFRLGAKS
jgi:acetyl/propionyl-CoA carboxylase alpha subunit